ncbi:response regulator transcription factor [Acidaminobacter sp. JC074]|uniref:response regulator transcription factor n=1 Tax=Acidaminobacter sp. JC074 TaxID=2530199 RepID=UPI001F0DC27E|nr:response regulator transcription factor [Acidaminobacter sp. JC074]MCH4886545.1 response regulator transcription factor [Acidaminobacter sp. JC074]
MRKILVVDDENKIREFICFFLNKEGYETVEASNGSEALDLMKNENFDLVILDLMMPIMNGFETCLELRKFSSIPVIMLTAVEGENDHIRGYDVGVDDYITKPFKMKILMAKINRILGKSLQGFEQYDSLKINPSSMEVMVLDQMIELAPKEFDLLYYLISNKNIVLTRDQILDRVWGFDFEGGTRVVDNHIKKLRNKLQPFSDKIKTVIGHGYKLEV